MEAALRQTVSELGHEYDMVVGGERLRTADKIISTNPARPSQVIGVHQAAGPEHADDSDASGSRGLCRLGTSSHGRSGGVPPASGDADSRAQI